MSTFKLMTPDRPVVGERIHRDGWPWVVRHMRERASKSTTQDAIPVDDFCEVWFAYNVRQGSLNKYQKDHLPHTQHARWCGVWHHPARVDSPIPGEDQRELRVALRAAREVLPSMSCAVCFCPAQRDVIKQHVPWCNVLCTYHPVPVRGPERQWSLERWESGGRAFFQSGFFLRDTRMIYRIPETSGQRARVKPYLGWHVQRDSILKKRTKFVERRSRDVLELSRLTDEAYDQWLASSVIVSHAFGAAANNVTLEAMSACAPIITNRCAASEHYLGSDYPLLYDTVEQAIEFSADVPRINAAHEYMMHARYDARTDIDVFLDELDQHCASDVRQIAR